MPVLGIVPWVILSFMQNFLSCDICFVFATMSSIWICPCNSHLDVRCVTCG